MPRRPGWDPRHFRLVMAFLLCEKDGSHFIWILRVRRAQKVRGSRGT